MPTRHVTQGEEEMVRKIKWESIDRLMQQQKVSETGKQCGGFPFWSLMEICRSCHRAGVGSECANAICSKTKKELQTWCKSWVILVWVSDVFCWFSGFLLPCFILMWTIKLMFLIATSILKHSTGTSLMVPTEMNYQTLHFVFNAAHFESFSAQSDSQQIRARNFQEKLF